MWGSFSILPVEPNLWIAVGFPGFCLFFCYRSAGHRGTREIYDIIWSWNIQWRSQYFPSVSPTDLMYIFFYSTGECGQRTTFNTWYARRQRRRCQGYHIWSPLWRQTPIHTQRVTSGIFGVSESTNGCVVNESVPNTTVWLGQEWFVVVVSRDKTRITFFHHELVGNQKTPAITRDVTLCSQCLRFSEIVFVGSRRCDWTISYLLQQMTSY